MNRKKILIFIINLTFIIFTIESCDDNSDQITNSPVAEYTQIDFEPSVSNDNTKMIYVHSDIDFKLSGIYLYNFATAADSLFINGSARCPDFSPDGNRIVYSMSNVLFKIKINGDSLTSLTTSGKNNFAKWNNDGSKIAYVNSDCSGSGNCGLYVMNSDGTENTLIESDATYPEWTDNGNNLIYFKPIKNSNGETIGDSLFSITLNKNQKNFIRIFNGDDHKYNRYLNYKSGEIIFCSTNSRGYTYIYKYNLFTNVITQLTQSQGWSPYASEYSNKIIYTNRNQGNGRLWMMNTDGSSAVQLTP